MPAIQPKSMRWRWVAAVGVLWLGTIAFVGCTPQKRYRVLSFFFDGVPDPDAAKAASVVRRSTKGATVYLHRPFAENNCDACHQKTNDVYERANVTADVCLKCHAAVLNAHPIMHGPVVNVVCMRCHSPHQSVNEHLMRAAPGTVCTQCHEPTSLSIGIKEHADAKSNCTSCHSGHGGTTHDLLLAMAPTTRPLGPGRPGNPPTTAPAPPAGRPGERNEVKP